LFQIYNMEGSTSGHFSRGMESINNNERFKNGREYFVRIYKKKTISGWQRAEIYEHAGWNALSIDSLFMLDCYFKKIQIIISVIL